MATVLDEIRQFAPMVYLHPYDNHRPTSVEAFFGKTKLYMSSQGVRQEIAPQVTPDVLVQRNDPNYYLDYPAQNYPTGHDDFATGDAIAPSPDGSFGICRAPMYVKVFDRGSYVDLKYAFFYEFNGPQAFRVGIRSGLSTRKRTFIWHRFARHMGDWEHVTVRLTPDRSRLDRSRVIKVFYSQHADSTAIDRPDFVDGTHPVAYAALSSHANYPNQAITTEKEIDGVAVSIVIAWAKLVDTTEPDDVVVYKEPNPLFPRVEWAFWRHGSSLVAVDGDAEAGKWLNFQGRFGPTLDNSNIDRPPPMTLDAHDRLFDIAKVIKLSGKLEDLLRGNAPASPQQQGWWDSKEL